MPPDLESFYQTLSNYLINLSAGAAVLVLAQVIMTGVVCALQPFFLVVVLRFIFWVWQWLNIQEARNAWATRPASKTKSNWLKAGVGDEPLNDEDQNIFQQLIRRQRNRWSHITWAVYFLAVGVPTVAMLFFVQQPYAALALGAGLLVIVLYFVVVIVIS